MKFELEFSRVFPHSLDKVWRALTTPDALAQWLMATDFAAEKGREFRMWCEAGQGRTEVYFCKVLEIEPQMRMLWSWVLEGREQHGATTVEFRLEAEGGGTRVTVVHRGDRDEETIERFKGGWPVKLEQLGETLEG